MSKCNVQTRQDTHSIVEAHCCAIDLILMSMQFCTRLAKAYVAKSSCNHTWLTLLHTYTLIKIDSSGQETLKDCIMMTFRVLSYCFCIIIDVFADNDSRQHKSPSLPHFPNTDAPGHTAPEPPHDKPLPQGWSCKVDHRSGRLYYEKWVDHWNTAKGASAVWSVHGVSHSI